MIVIGEALSWIVSIFLEIVKCVAVLACAIKLAITRSEYVECRVKAGERIPRWLRHGEHYNLDRLQPEECNAKPRDVRRGLLWSLGFFAVFLALQFGLNHVDLIAWGRLGLAILTIVVIGGFALFDSDNTEPGWRATLMGIIILICVILGVAAAVTWPFSLQEAWSRRETVTISEETVLFDQPGTGLTVTVGRSGNTFSFVGALELDPYSEKYNTAIGFIEDHGTEYPYVVRKETVTTYYSDVSRLPIAWTYNHQQTVTYEYHYRGLSDITFDLPPSFIIN